MKPDHVASSTRADRLRPAVRAGLGRLSSRIALAGSLIPTVAVAALALILPSAVQASTTYTVVDLNPTAPTAYAGSSAYGAGPAGQQAGYGDATAAAGYHALLWNSSASNVIDLNPTGFTQSNAYGAWGGMQIGTGYGSSTGNVDNALLWSGSAASAINLNPTGYTSSFAMAIAGKQIVGSGYGTATGNDTSALLWTSPSASSAVNLNPTGFTYSNAIGVGNGQQVGVGSSATLTGGANQALLWSGSAASAIDLNPTGFSTSHAVSVFNGVQVGYGNGSVTSSYDHALLWTGSAASAVDLNPTGYSMSYAYGSGNGVQVGYGYNTAAGATHALLWSGSAASAVDLNPAGYTSSVATSVDPYGVIVGYGMILVNGVSQQHALSWYASNNKYFYASTAASGAFATASNWLNSANPQATTDNGYIVQSDGTSRTVAYGATNPFGNLYVDATGAGSLTLALSTGTLSVGATETIGEVGTGAVNQSGGANAIGGKLVLGMTYGSSGAYTLSATGNLTVASATNVGLAGSGTYTQTGGTANVGSLAVGATTGGSGTVSLGGGNLSDTAASIGTNGGLGNFFQSAGSHTVTGTVFLGTSGGTGSYTMSGGTLTAGQISVGAAGTLALSSGNINAPVTVASGGQVNASGGTVSGTVTNSGNVNVSGGGTQTFSSITNNPGGVVDVAGTSVTLTGALTNNGTYTTDPATKTLTALTVGSAGYLVAGSGGKFALGGNLTSTSIQSAFWNTANATLEFSSSGTGAHTLSVDGADLGRSYAGYTNNFAWGTLQLDAGQSLTLTDGNATAGGGLYVSSLALAGGTSQISSITGNGMNIYYDPSVASNAYLGDKSYALTGGGVIQAVSVPEPMALLWLPIGAIGVLARRRRSNPKAAALLPAIIPA